MCLLMAREISILEIQKYGDRVSEFYTKLNDDAGNQLTFVDFLGFSDDLNDVNHMYNIVTDEDYGYNDQIHFYESFHEFTEREFSYLVDWHVPFMGIKDGVLGEFEVDGERFELTFAEFDVLTKEYYEKLSVLGDEYNELRR